MGCETSRGESGKQVSTSFRRRLWEAAMTQSSCSLLNDDHPQTRRVRTRVEECGSSSSSPARLSPPAVPSSTLSRTSSC